MKLSTLIYSSILSLTLPVALHAQLKCPPIAGGNNDGKIDVTFGAGQTLLYGDIQHKSNQGFGMFLKGEYQVYKGFYAGLEAQAGKLMAKGVKDQTSPNWDPREANNHYIAALITATAYPYRFLVSERELMRKGFIERNILNGFHIGLGAGLVFNSYQFENNVERNANSSLISEGDNNGPHDLISSTIAGDNDEPIELITKDFKKKTKSTLLPVLHLGLSVPINKKTSYNGRYLSAVVLSQFNFAMDENLDGYDPRLPGGERRSNAKYDMYNFTALGIKYTF